MKRKYDFDRLTHLHNVRLNEPENLEFKRVAERLQTTRSRLMRKMIRELIGEGPDFLDREWILFEKLAYQLSAIGRNLNQLVRAYHSDQGARITVDLSLLGEVLERTESVKREIYRLIERCNYRWVKTDGALSALRSDPRPLRADEATSAHSEGSQP